MSISNRLNGIDQVRIDSTIRFSHQHPLLASHPLILRSGANAIKWAYNLNTQVTPTYGGEVVQILSCNVGPMQISGNPMGSYDREGNADVNQTVYDELERIRKWFLTYMHIAGTINRKDDRTQRDQRAVRFEYPARGWEFWIQPTNLSGIRAARDVVSPEWALTAEILSDNDLNFFSGMTMAAFTDTITSQAALASADATFQRMSQIGFDPNSPWIDPTSAANAVTDLGRFGDNFQALLGAWSSGDFAHFGFNQLNGTGDNKLTSDQQDYWTKIFGSNTITLSASVTSTGIGGSSTYSGPNNPATQSDLISDIINTARASGIPGLLALAIAKHESGINPDARSPNDGGNGIDGVGLFQVHAPGGAKDTPTVRKASADHSNKVTDTYPSGQQIEDAIGANGWITSSVTKQSGGNFNTLSNDQMAQLAFGAQRGSLYTIGDSTSGSCDPKFASDLKWAQSQIDSAGLQVQTGLRAAVVGYANSGIGVPTYSQYTSRNWKADYSVGKWAGIATDCSGFASLCYGWGTNFDERYDPSGNDWAGGSTVTMFNHMKTIDQSAVQAGDVAIFGPGGSDHVVIFVENWHGPNTLVVSHGGTGSKVNNGTPKRVPFSYESAAFSAVAFRSLLP